MRRVELSQQMRKALRQYLTPLLTRCSSPEQQRRVYEKYYPILFQHVRQWYAQHLNPFNLCPRTIMIWLLIGPYNAIGINLLGLREVVVFWRQQMEPNETIYLLMRMLELHVPFPLMLLIMFGTIGLVVTDGANRLVKAAQGQLEETNLLDPFNLTPRMSVYFPIYNYQTTLGILLIDFRHLEISLKQALDPNETLLSLIRFSDVYSPFPLPLMVMFLSMGLFLVGKIQDLK